MKNPTGIKKLPNGKFQARYFAGFDSQGKRQYPSQTFDFQSEAIKWRNEAKQTNSRVLEKHDLTVAEYLEKYLAIKRSKVREKTIETYSSVVACCVGPEIGAIKLARLRPLQLATWQSALVQRVAGSTARLAQVILFDALKMAVSLQLLSANPLTGLPMPKSTKRKFHPLTVEQALTYLEACQTKTYGLVLTLGLQTGLRPEEYLGLKWSDIGLTKPKPADSVQGVLTVRQVVQFRPGGGWRWEEPKTAKGRRSVCFPFELYQQLQEHRRRQLERKLKCGGAWNEADLVFCSSRGTPVLQNNLWRDHRVAVAAAGLPRNFRLYDLRHAFVTFSLLAGVDPKTVSAEAGHASVAFTMDNYGHVLQEQFEGASEKRAALFAGRRAMK